MDAFSKIVSPLIADITSQKFYLKADGQTYTKIDNKIFQSILCDNYSPIKDHKIVEIFKNNTHEMSTMDDRLYGLDDHQVHKCDLPCKETKMSLADEIFNRIRQGNISDVIEIEAQDKRLNYVNNNTFSLNYFVNNHRLLQCTSPDLKRNENGLPQTIVCKGSHEPTTTDKFDRNDQLTLSIFPYYSYNEARYCEKSIKADYAECRYLPFEDLENQVKSYLADDLRDHDFLKKIDAFEINKYIAVAGFVSSAITIYQLIESIVELRKDTSPDGSESKLYKQGKVLIFSLGSLVLTIGSSLFYYNLPQISPGNPYY